MSTSAAGPGGPAWLTIGAMDRLSGKSVSAIRYYEQTAAGRARLRSA